MNAIKVARWFDDMRLIVSIIVMMISAIVGAGIWYSKVNAVVQFRI